MAVAWKKVVTSSGTAGQLLGIDLTEKLNNDGIISTGAPPANYVLTANGNGAAEWQNPYIHPTEGAETLTVTASTTANNEVVKSFGFTWDSEADGHITGSSSEVSVNRNLNLNNFGYYGSATANSYTHPVPTTAGSLAVSYTANANQAQVMETMTFGFTANAQGHLTAIDTSQQQPTKATITLPDLGYQGNLEADKYQQWKVVTDSGGSATIQSNETVAFEGGGDITLGFSNNKITVIGTANALGEIESVSAGDGMLIEGSATGVGDGTVPNITIALQDPATAGNPATAVSDSLIGQNDPEIGTSGGHSHAVAVTGDGAANPGAILAVPASGLLVIQDLVTAGNLEVQGGHIYFDSTDVAFSDNVIQVNTTADGTGYQDRDSAIIYGNVNLTDGGKIINTDSSFVFTDLPNADSAELGGTVDKGNPKPIECQHIAAGEAYLGRAWVQNSVKVEGGVEVSDYIKLNANPSTAPAVGSLRFNAGKLWIHI